MKSIKTKIVTTMLTSVLSTTVLLLFISILSLNILNRNDSNLLLEYIARSNSTLINNSLESTEQNVDSISIYILEQLKGNLERFTEDTDWRKYCLDAVESLALSEVSGIKDVEAVYFRVANELGNPAGFFYQYYEGTGKLEKRLLTDINLYDKDDITHVGWYYIPKEAKKALWLKPYDNYNLKKRIVSYEMPLYCEDTFVGIVGIDINVKVTSRNLANIRAYQTGGAVLFDQDDNIMYHKSHVRGLKRELFTEVQEAALKAAKESAETGFAVEYNNKQDKMYAIRLQDGMTLCISAPLSEINASQRSVIAISLAGSVLILALILLITMLQINGFLKPLKELTRAAEKLAGGDMEVTFHAKHKPEDEDEIERLADTFETMASSLKRYFDHFHSLAYTDNMTGLNNKAAFDMTRDVIESEVLMGRASFTIIVMDVNNLKTINDSIGHEKGDELLIHCAHCMRETFVGFPLYRIGGDEFCAIINNHIEPERLITRLQETAASMSSRDMDTFHVAYQIAAGAAVYNKQSDTGFQDVFNRADAAMYENKKALKHQA